LVALIFEISKSLFLLMLMNLFQTIKLFFLCILMELKLLKKKILISWKTL